MRKIISRGVWYLLPNLDSGWALGGIVFLVQLIFSSLDFTTFQLVLDLEPIKMQLHRKDFSMWLTLWLTLWLTFIYVAHVAQSEPQQDLGVADPLIFRSRDRDFWIPR